MGQLAIVDGIEFIGAEGWISSTPMLHTIEDIQQREEFTEVCEDRFLTILEAFDYRRHKHKGGEHYFYSEPGFKIHTIGFRYYLGWTDEEKKRRICRYFVGTKICNRNVVSQE